MSAKKHGRMKKKCDDYRRLGKHELNKAEKQKKHLARQEHFKLRRQEGKAYEYTKPKTDKEKKERTLKNVDRRCQVAKLDSWFGKLEYELTQEKLKAKEKATSSRKNNKGKKESSRE